MLRPSALFSRVTSRINRSHAQHIPLAQARKRTVKKLTHRELIQLESEIGRSLFGELPKGHRREFFNFNEMTWIWHEEWRDEQNISRELTTKYEIHGNEIIKVQPGPRFIKVEGDELQNLHLAITLYHERVMRDVYGRDPKTGKKLS